MKSTKLKKNKNGKSKKFGNVELPDEAFLTKNAKFRVTMYIDLEVLDLLRKRAREKSLPYQTYINQVLRNVAFGKEDEKRIREIVRDEISRKSA